MAGQVSGPIAVLCGFNADGELRPLQVDDSDYLYVKTESTTVDASDVTYTPSTLADWDGGADPGNVDGALDQLAERSKDLETLLPYSPYPKRALVFADELTVLTGNPFSLSQSTSQNYNYRFFQNAAADGDEFTWSWVLDSGDYTLSILASKSTAYGIHDIYGKHSSEASFSVLASTIDWYGSTTLNVTQTASITLSKAGLWVFKSTVNGKNASSTGYIIALTKIWIKPSSD